MFAQSSETEIYQVEPQLTYELETMFETNIPIRRMSSMLESFLLSHVQIKGASDEFNRYVRTYMIPFLRDALRQAVVYGWTAICKAKIKDERTGERLTVPSTIPVKYYSIQLHVNKLNLRRQWKFVNTHNNQEDNNVEVAMLYGEQNYETRGAIFSPLICLLPKLRFLRQMEQNYVRAEFIRSNPHIFLCEAKSNPLNNSDTMHSTEYYRSINGLLESDNALNREATVLNNSYRYMDANIELHQQQQKQLARNAQAQTIYGSEYSQVFTQYDNNLFVCPPNLQLASSPNLPVSTVSLTELENKFESDVVQAFGLPVRALHSSGSRSTGGVQSQRRTSSSSVSRTADIPNALDLAALNAGLDRYRDFIKSLVSRAYKLIFKIYLDPELVIIELPDIYKKLMDTAMGLDHEDKYKASSKKKSTTDDDETNNKKRKRKNDSNKKKKDSNNKSKEEDDDDVNDV